MNSPKDPLPGQLTNKNANNEDLPEDLVRVLKDLVKNYEEEDSWVRKQQLKLWKKNEEFWHGIQFIFWSESRQDWIAPTETKWFQQEEGREEAEGPFYDFVVNIYKAHGESVIAALSAEVPAVRFPPDDAEDEDDLITSKTYGKIADLIQRHNNAKMTLLFALFIMWNQGLVCAYHAPKASKDFGMNLVPKYEDRMTCEECGPPMNDEGTPASKDELDLTPHDPNSDLNNCPTCGMPLVKAPVVVGYDEMPKSRIIWELYGPLFVQLPYNATKQEECGFLFLKKDMPLALLKDLYPHIADKLDDLSDQGQFEKVARTPSTFSAFSRVDENRGIRCLKRCWFRPWVLAGIPEHFAKEREQLRKKFPQGIYCAFVGDTFAEARDEDLDRHWTVGRCGLSTYIHCDALGQPLISIQEMRNVLVNLVQETVEHGIPSVYADTEVLDFDVYSRHEARPGMIYPAVAKPGQRIADGFYEGLRATISKELTSVWKQMDQDGQFVVGSFPSIYGGPSEGKSRTAAEYNTSRQMALQRLSIAWQFVIAWWAKLMEKSVHMYVENVIDDERFVVKEHENYVNVWIRRSEMQGKVGEVEPEASEVFPVSMAQKQDLFMKLIGLNNEFIQAALMDPENRRFVCDVLGDPDLYIPGEDQRIKQAREIQTMMKGQPVEPEPLIDDDEIHIATTKNFLVGPVGMDLKSTNPEAYQLIVQHLMMHQQGLQAKTAGQFEDTQPGEPPGVGVEG